MPVTFNSKTNKWVADYTDQFGKRHRHGFDTKKEAKAELLKCESAVQSRTFQPDAMKTTFATVANDYIADCKRRARHGDLDEMTVRGYETNLRRYGIGGVKLSCPRFPNLAKKTFMYPLGSMLIGDIKPNDIVEFKAALRDLDLGVSTTKAIAQNVGAVLGYAVERGIITTNVARSVRRRRGRSDRRTEVQPPEKDTIAALISAAASIDPTAGLMIKFASLTGFRSSEQRALRWKNVDFERAKVRVVERVNQLAQIGVPKTEAGTRTVPISAGLVSDLRAHWQRSRFQEPDDFVFSTARGTAMFHGPVLKRWMNPAWVIVLAEGEGKHQRSNWHYLRHFAISCWIEKDVPLKQVQKWAGHSAASMTLDVYGHLFKSASHASVMDDIAADIFDDD